MRVRRAGFRSHKTIEQFDFGFIPKLNQTLIQDLATCCFVAERANVLADHEDVFVALHFLEERFANRFQVRDLSH